MTEEKKGNRATTTTTTTTREQEKKEADKNTRGNEMANRREGEGNSKGR